MNMKFKAIIFDLDGTLISSDNGSLLPGVANLLKNLVRQNIELYLWTRASSDRARELLQGHGVANYFTDIATVDSDPPKPYPQALMRMVGHFPKEQLALVGDSLSDISAAKKYGIEPLGANWYHHLPAHHLLLKNFGAQRVFDHIEDLQGYLLY
jgi:phosphoglycolate phosphatase-like HAD superfamily hydrolase